MPRPDPHNVIESLRKQYTAAKQKRKQLRLLVALCTECYVIDTAAALEYGQEALRVAASVHDQPALVAEAHLRYGTALWKFAEYKAAAGHYRIAERLLGPLREDRLTSRLWLYQGNLHLVNGEYPQTVAMLNKALNLAVECGEHEVQHSVLNNLGVTYHRLGDYHQMFLYYSRALEHSVARSAAGIGVSYLNVGSAYFFMGDLDTALEYMDKAREAFENEGDDYGLVKLLVNRGTLLIDQEEFQQGLESYQQGLKLSTRHHFHAETGFLLHRIGRLYCMQGKYSQALPHLEKAIAFARQKDLMYDLAYPLGNKSQALLELKRYKQFRESIEITMEVCQKNDDKNALAETHNLLSSYYTAQKDFTQALHHYKLYVQLIEETYQADRERERQQMHLRLEVEKAVRESEALKATALELERSLDEKRGELSAMALAIAQKNSLLEKLESRLRQAATGTPAGLQGIIRDIGAMRSGDDQWSQLQRQFESIDEGFRHLLLDRSPAISAVEMKVAMLMRLNLATKDIASALCTSARTVETHRYQLRKKLRLTKDENLSTFLAAL